MGVFCCREEIPHCQVLYLREEKNWDMEPQRIKKGLLIRSSRIKNIKAGANKQNTLSSVPISCYNYFIVSTEKDVYYKGQKEIQFELRMTEILNSNGVSFQEAFNLKLNIDSDILFPHNIKSIDNLGKVSTICNRNSETIQNLTWQRPSQIGRLFTQFQLSNIFKGLLDNSFTLTAYAAFSKFPHRLHRLFLNEEITKTGVYSVVLYVEGIPVIIAMNDYFPTSRNGWLFTHSKSEDIYVQLIEKAWAKINGSYLSSKVGNPSDFVGCLSEAPSENVIHSRFETMKLFELLKEAFNRNYIMISSTYNTFDFNNEGLEPSKEYSILGVYEVDIEQTIEKLRLIKIFSSDQAKWKGSYSDVDFKWKNELKKKLNFDCKAEGVFFMDINDFVKYFKSTFVALIHDDYKYSFAKILQTPEDSFICCKFEVSKQTEQLIKNKSVYLTLHGNNARLNYIPKLQDKIKDHKEDPPIPEENNSYSIKKSTEFEEIERFMNKDCLDANKHNNTSRDDLSSYFNKGHQMLTLILARYTKARNAYEYVSSISLPEEKVHLELIGLDAGEYHIFGNTQKRFNIVSDEDSFNLVVSVYSPTQMNLQELTNVKIAKEFYKSIITSYLISKTAPVYKLDDIIFRRDEPKKKCLMQIDNKSFLLRPSSCIVNTSNKTRNIEITNEIARKLSLQEKTSSFISMGNINNDLTDKKNIFNFEIYFSPTEEHPNFNNIAFLLRNSVDNQNVDLIFEVEYIEGTMALLTELKHKFKQVSDKAIGSKIKKTRCIIEGCIEPLSDTLIVFNHLTLSRSTYFRIINCGFNFRRVSKEDVFRRRIEENLSQYTKQVINNDCWYSELEYDNGIIFIFVNDSRVSTYRFKIALEELENLRVLMPKKHNIIFTIPSNKFEFVVLERIDIGLDETDYDVSFVYKKIC